MVFHVFFPVHFGTLNEHPPDDCSVQFCSNQVNIYKHNINEKDFPSIANAVVSFGLSGEELRKKICFSNWAVDIAVHSGTNELEDKVKY